MLAVCRTIRPALAWPCASIALCLWLAACGHDAAPVQPPADLPGSHLAQHVERLLDDPSTLPRAVTPATPENDAGAAAPDAESAPDDAGAPDAVAAPAALTELAAAPTPAPEAPAPILPVPVRPKKEGVEREANGHAPDQVGKPGKQSRRERMARLLQAKHERRLAAVARRKAAREEAKKNKAKEGAQGKTAKGQAGTTAKTGRDKPEGEVKSSKDKPADAKARKAAARAEAKARKLAARAEARARKLAARAEAKARKAAAKAGKKDAAEPKTEPTTPTKGEVQPAAPTDGADATELYYSGKRKLDAGDLSGAIADLKASQKVRSSPRTLTLLGRAHFDAGDLTAAAKALQQAGNHDDAQLLLATLYQQTGKTAQARKVYEAFLKAHPDHPRAAWVRNLLQSL